jgi:serine protease Do
MRWDRKFVWPVVASLAITGSVYLGAGPWPGRLSASEPEKPQVAAVAAQGLASAMELSKAFRAVHDAVKDTVVNINMSKKVSVAKMPRIPDEMRKMLPPGFEFGEPDSSGHGGVVGGTGSGIVVSADGFILTNNHVVDGADDISVRFDDGKEFKAKVIGTDPKTDLAVVKVDAKGLKYAALGDSDAEDVGDWVLAFGSPFGFEQTMTQGIISAKGRSQLHIIEANNPQLKQLTYENFLQTDAAINPGNSGGPLVNLKGEVIGINTAIASRSGAYNGIGFSIPSNDAKYIMESLIKNGKVVRGYMGVMISDIREGTARDQARKSGYTGERGVLVSGIQADSPGGKGGLKLGDIITTINGKAVEGLAQLRTAVARTAPGTDLQLSVFRDGKTVEFKFPVGTQPDSAIASAAPEEGSSKPAKYESSDLGISVKGLDAATARKYHMEAGKGVVVSQMDPNGLAAEMGLEAGDVITSVDSKEVTSAKEFGEVMGKAKLGEGVRMTVHAADGSERLVYIEKK